MPNATAERNGTMSQTAQRHEISGCNGQARPALDVCYGQIGNRQWRRGSRGLGHVDELIQSDIAIAERQMINQKWL
jgi:hypothetical protein